MEDGTVTKKDLADFKDFVRAEIITHKETLKRQFVEAREAAKEALTTSKRVKAESGELSFKRVGNERNYKFNKQVLENLYSLRQVLTHHDSLNTEALTLLEETVNLVEERNRLIRIADTSEAGWLTVKQYESVPVSLGEEDSKKIRKAEKEALKIQERQRRKKNVEKFAFRSQRSTSARGFRQFGQQWQPNSGQQAQYSHPRDYGHPSYRSSCRYCGSPSHWWRECPVRIGKSNFHMSITSTVPPTSRP